MDYFIIVVAVAAGGIFHWWLFVRIRRWGERDLALSMAGEDPLKRAYMLEKLAEAKSRKVPKAELEGWLHSAANAWAEPGPAEKD